MTKKTEQAADDLEARVEDLEERLEAVEGASGRIHPTFGDEVPEEPAQSSTPSSKPD
jgi:hypothetical protein